MSTPQPTASAARSLEDLKNQLEFQTRLNSITQRLHDADSLMEVMPEIMGDLRGLLEADKVTIYQRGRSDSEIVSRYKVADGLREIRVPLSNGSVAGYVALTQKAVAIKDVYDDAELKTIHPDLSFNRTYDMEAGYRTRSMIVVPIKFQQVLLGVLQLLNHTDGTPFGNQQILNTLRFTKVLAQKLRYELHSTRGPFDLLVERRYLTREQLDTLSARAEKDKISLIQILRDELRILPSDIGSSLEHYYQVPYFPYDPSIELPRSLIAGLNETYLRRQLWVPVAGDRSKVTILIDNPNDTGRIEEIQRVVKADSYIFKVGLPEDILRFLGQDVGSSTTAPANIKELVGRMQSEQRAAADLSSEVEEPDESEATVVQLVNRIIEESYSSKASDIHVEPDRNGAQVRVRVDGACRHLLDIPATHIRAVVSRIKIIAKLDITERRKPQDGKLMLRLNGQPLELRVATLPTVHGEEVVLRILTASEPLPLDRINLSSANELKLKQVITKPHGIFLVVGPTGSGKTTTLHAILGHINTPDVKIWTAEDPVEITQAGLHQLQVQPKIGVTFATALRAFLRADPDIIMVGEMRDAETVQASIEASLTGHLVFSTLHTNSAAETVVRLLDLGADPVNFADALQGILAQRLVRTLCTECKTPYTPEEQELFQLRHHYGEAYYDELKVDHANLTLYKPGKCAACNLTGYKGRTAIHELMIITPTVQKLIYTRANATEIRQAAMADGMRTLRQDGVTKLLKGQIDLAQLMHVVGE
ncbi:MAG: ATPase, T2SS/T4P/T4SS family [Sulfuricellaceae bacterium]|nr:ATPase, T2SS/T4P/T4SS family [Sulfuricellaceae bacterium]